MARKTVSIGIVATGRPITLEVAERVQALAASLYPDRPPNLRFHPQCFMSHGHFAGDDAARADAFVELANDPAVDAVWIARGGYGACRMTGDALARLTEPARAKRYLGYSDAGVLLSGLYAAGIGGVAHGPMPIDIVREGGEAAVARALKWLVERDLGGVERHIVPGGLPTAAFNMTILSSLLGTPLEPRLAGHVLMLEEVAEYHYRIDRALFHITSNAGVRKAAGIRLGRCSDIPENDTDFGMDEAEIVQAWCARAGIAYLGRADIGHDAGNKVVPFGSL